MATQPTIRTVAELAGVSTATVSRVLSPGPNCIIKISDGTTKRVLEAARALDYTPSALASGLRSRRTRIVGVIVPDVNMPFIAGVIAALAESLGNHDYDFLLAQSAKPRSARAFERYRVDGVILVGDQHGDDLGAEYASRMPGRVVGFGRLIPDVSAVIVDNRLGERLVVDHLAALGHTRVAFCGASEVWDAHQRRFSAFVEAVQSSGLDLNPRYIVREADHPDAPAGAEATSQLLALPVPPTATVFYNDEMAIGGLSALQSAGCSSPRDMSVVGFDDIPWARYCSPALTTVKQPVRLMAETAVSTLLDLVDGRLPGDAGPYRELPPDLVVRSSTGTIGARTAGRTTDKRTNNGGTSE